MQSIENPGWIVTYQPETKIAVWPPVQLCNSEPPSRNLMPVTRSSVGDDDMLHQILYICSLSHPVMHLSKTLMIYHILLHHAKVFCIPTCLWSHLNGQFVREAVPILIESKDIVVCGLLPRSNKMLLRLLPLNFDKKCLPKCVIATRLISRQKCVNLV